MQHVCSGRCAAAAHHIEYVHVGPTCVVEAHLEYARLLAMACKVALVTAGEGCVEPESSLRNVKWYVRGEKKVQRNGMGWRRH
jgi:hypothetical protein